MPYYIFENSKGKTAEVFFHMNDKKEYFGESGDEKDWKRVFTNPCASFDSEIDPFDSKQFVRKTENKKGTLGEIMDRSKELSKKRAEKLGKDPVKERHMAEWSKLRKGRVHPDAKPKVIENKIFKLEL